MRPIGNISSRCSTGFNCVVEYWWAYPLLGAVVGFLAGLLGIGGGLQMVPVLTMIFKASGFPPQYIVHLALGTSVATILLTSLASVRSHHRRGAVNWRIVRELAPGIVLGTLMGAVVAGMLDTLQLGILFTAFTFYVATRMLTGGTPNPRRALPGPRGMFAAGTLIGGLSSFAAIGGAVLSVPFMLRRNVPMHEAVGTSAAIGFPIAATATIGYVAMGWGLALPAHSIGFVYLPAFAGIVVMTVLTAPLGAAIAHRTPGKRLRQIFALFLYALAARMLASLL